METSYLSLFQGLTTVEVEPLYLDITGTTSNVLITSLKCVNNLSSYSGHCYVGLLQMWAISSSLSSYSGHLWGYIKVLTRGVSLFQGMNIDSIGSLWTAQSSWLYSKSWLAIFVSLGERGSHCGERGSHCGERGSHCGERGSCVQEDALSRWGRFLIQRRIILFLTPT